jgi:hypothetical protein
VGETIAGWCGNRLAVRPMTWPSVHWASGSVPSRADETPAEQIAQAGFELGAPLITDDPRHHENVTAMC